MRTGCPAQMTISRQPDGKYLVIHFEKEHNHELVPREQAHMLPSQRKVIAAQAIEADMADKFGIPQKLAFKFKSVHGHFLTNTWTGPPIKYLGSI